MIVEGEPIGDYDARNAAEAGRVCGELTTAWWHLRRGLKVVELDAACLRTYRVYQCKRSLVGNRVRQRTLARLKENHPEEFERRRDYHRLDVDFHAIGSGEAVRPSVLANRARQRAMADLGRDNPEEYRAIYAQEHVRFLEEMEAGS